MMNLDDAINKNVDLWSIGKCVFCKQPTGGDSKILKCLHIICKGCHDRERVDSIVQCKCQIVTKGELINFSTRSPNESEVKICCEDSCNATAKKICMYCKTIYCKPCSKIHLSQQQNHKPDLMMKYPLKKEFLSCTKCIEKCVEIHCTNCSIMICSLCFLTFHKTHQYDVVTTMAKEIKSSLNNELLEVREINKHIDVMIEKSDSRIQKFTTRKHEINEIIDARMKMIHEEIDKRSSELKQFLEINYKDAVNSINKNKEVLNDLKKENEYYHSLASSILSRDTIFEYLKLSKTVVSHIIIARSHTQHMPDEMENSKVFLEYNDEESVQKCIETIQVIGNIISSPIVRLPELKIALNLNHSLSEEIHINTQPLEQVKEEICENSMISADSDSDSEPFVICACCNQLTEEFIQCITCKRFFHYECHIPQLAAELIPKNPSTTKWKCTVCQDIKIHKTDISGRVAIGHHEKKVFEHILMNLYCQNEDSNHFRDCLDRESYSKYYEKISDPICLNDIKKRLESNCYKLLIDVLKDMRKVFLNAMSYYFRTDPYYKSAYDLNTSLNRMMAQWLPTFDTKYLEQ